MQVISIICSVLFRGVNLIPFEVAYGTICYFDLLSVHSHCILHGDCVTPLNYSQTPNKRRTGIRVAECNKMVLHGCAYLF